MPVLFQTSAQESQPSLDDGWDYEFLEELYRGVDVSQRPEMVETSSLTQGDNVRFEKKRLLNDWGYKDFASDDLSGTVKLTYQFFKKDGSSELICITNDFIYNYSSTGEDWQFLTEGTTTTLSAQADPLDTVISVTSAASFAVDDYIGITLDNGKQHKAQIDSISVNDITIDTAIPTVAASGKAVIKAAELSGNDDNAVSITTWAAFDKLYFCNGVDTPKEYDGSSVSDVSNLPGTTFVGNIIRVFAARLVIMGTTEDGTSRPQRVRWTNVGTDDQWDASTNLNDLYETEDFIKAGETLSGDMYVYKERSIVRMRPTGDSIKPFEFRQLIDAEGARNVDAVVNLGDVHFFFGNSNFYFYRGGYDLEPIGDSVYDKIFGQQGELNPSQVDRAFCAYIEELDEIISFYAAGSDDFPRTAAKFKLATQAWSFRKYTRDITGFGFFQRSSTQTWNDLQGSWLVQTYAWNARQFQANTPTLHLCGGRVYEVDYITATDDGVGIPWTLQTKDFYVPNWNLRFDRFDLKLSGENVTVEVSVDEGASYVSLGTINPGAVTQKITLFKQFVADRIRIRLSGSSAIALDWIGFTYKRESKY